MTHETIYSHEDTLKMLDSLFREEGPWWDQFYTDRDKGMPFFKDSPDENLVEYFGAGHITPGKVLELGCGGGRNAVYMARQGCSVDAIDISQAAIDWGMERARKHEVEVNFALGNIFEMKLEISDWEVYRQRSLRGGLGFTEEKLKHFFSDFETVEFRRMRQMDPPDNMFGQAFLWTALFRKNK